MLTLVRMLLCLAASLTAAGVCAGQNGSGSKSSSPQAESRPAQGPELTGVVAPRAVPLTVREVGAAKVSYYNGYRAAEVTLADLYREQGRAVSLHLLLTRDEGEAAEPEGVQVEFGPAGTPFKAKRLTVEADGKKFDFKIETGESTAKIGETFPPFADLDFSSFEQIAHGQSVKGRVGRAAFELSESQRQALRDLLRAIETPANRP